MRPEEISNYFVQVFPEFNKEERRLSLALYRLLSLGKPVTMEALQQATALPANAITQTLQTWPGVFFDNDDRVVAFWGLTLEKTRHRMIIDGHTLYTWCAWDTLFIPPLLQSSARVTSSCPVTGNEIELTVSPAGATAIGNDAVYVSFLTPDIDQLKKDVITCFCHFVYFFDNPKVAEQWIAEHAGTFLLSLNDAFLVGKQVNDTRYQSSTHTQGQPK